MKKLTLLVAGLLMVGSTYAGDGDKKGGSCCKGKTETCSKEKKEACDKGKGCCKKGADKTAEKPAPAPSK